MRKTGACINCGEVREMAAHGLCFTCYRREQRAEDNKFAARDRHNPGIRREHKKIFRGLTNVMVGLSDLGVQHLDVLTIRRLIDPYLEPISKFLAPQVELKEVKAPVNRERATEKLFTVHSELGLGLRGEPGSEADQDDDHGGNAA